MTRDEILDSLYATRRRLAVLIAQTAIETVSPDKLHALVLQRDRVVWLINRFIVADISASLADTEAALQRLTEATQRLDELKSTNDDVTKAIGIAKDVVAVASALLGTTR